VYAGGVQAYGWTERDASYKFKAGEGRGKNPESTKGPKYTEFGELIIRKIIEMYPPDVTFKAKMHRIRFLACVRLSV